MSNHGRTGFDSRRNDRDRSTSRRRRRRPEIQLDIDTPAQATFDWQARAHEVREEPFDSTETETGHEGVDGLHPRHEG